MAIVDFTTNDVVTRQHEGAVPFRKTITLATTHIDNADDTWLVYLFPQNAFLPGAWLPIEVDSTVLDSHMTPTLAGVVGIGDSDGVVDTSLIAAATLGTGVPDFTDATVAPWIDVGGKYLLVNLGTAAATAAAGSVVFGGVYFLNARANSA